MQRGRHSFLANPPALALDAASGGPPEGPTGPEVESDLQFIRYIAERKLRIPAVDVDAIVQEVFRSYLERSIAPARTKAWLVAATIRAAHLYWRVHARRPRTTLQRLTSRMKNVGRVIVKRLAGFYRELMR